MIRSKRHLPVISALLAILVVIISSFTVFAQTYKEAPMLSELVKAGKLPPVEERLPENPFVETPLAEIGTYGGTIRRVYTGVTDWWNLAFMGVRAEPLIHVTQEGEAIPNLLESWEYLEDGKVLRLTLRRGIKWSDGHPLTVDDIIYDLETRQNPNMPLESAGLASVVNIEGITKIDDYTVDLPLVEPYPLEFTAVYDATVSPKHYLSQFDPRYDSSKSWQDLETAWSPQRNSEALVNLPQLGPWVVTEYVEKTRIVAERNPYFWKVDSEGNQLPYIDKVEFRYVASTDTIPALVQAGQVDFLARHLTFDDYPFYKQNETNGNYRAAVLSQSGLGPSIRLNYAVQDMDLRNLFWNKDFRIALSIGLNREAISRALYFGQAEPWGISPHRDTPGFPGEEYAKLHTEYNPIRANEILDNLGLLDTDGDGVREVNGKPLTIVIDMDQGGGAGPVKVAELVAAQWREIGIRAIANTIERSLMLARWQDNTHTAFAWKLEGGINPVQMSFAWSTTADPSFMWNNVGVPLQVWVATGGKEGVEPPEFIKEINALMLEASTTLDAEKRSSLVKELVKLHTENLYAIPTTTFVDVGIVNKNLVNVPETWISGMELVGERSLRPWQMFYK